MLAFGSEQQLNGLGAIFLLLALQLEALQIVVAKKLDRDFVADAVGIDLPQAKQLFILAIAHGDQDFETALDVEHALVGINALFLLTTVAQTPTMFVQAPIFDRLDLYTTVEAQEFLHIDDESHRIVDNAK